MRRATGLPPLAAFCLSVFLTACASNPRAGRPAADIAEPRPDPTSVTVASPAPADQTDDQIGRLIAQSEHHFAEGRRQMQLGHLDQARLEFDRALLVLLESPYGARIEGRIREHFDRLVDRINAYELTALSQGDGFTEKKYEAASLDELLEISTFAGPAGPETEEAVRADLANTLHDVPIPLNGKVLSYVELFQGRLRDFIAQGLQRGSRYLPMIQSVFHAEGLPLDLAYVPLIESAFKPNALSRAKAKGVWQFMRRTALEHGLRQDWFIDERSDPEKSTYAAARYLRTLVKMFDGDWHLALASYNGGPGRVQRAMARSGLRDFWALSKGPGFLPRETREYVPMILAAIIIARNPAQYGFEVVADPPIEYEKVPLPHPIDLRRVAEWTGRPVDEIQALNPELRRWTTPIGYPEYELKMPAGTAERLQARLDNLSPDELVTFNRYVIKRGDTLSTIARRLQVSRAELAEANGLTLRSIIRPGQELVVPRTPAALMASRVDRPSGSVRAARPSAGTASAPRSASGNGKLIYVVKRGDTLSAIAQLFDTTVEAIKTWNKLTSTRIFAGDRLTILTAVALSSAME